jgi:hypothetical protein
MTEAEIIEKINSKRNELEEKMAQNASEEVIQALQLEIADLTEGLNSVEKSREKQVFLDECAG